MEFLDQLNFLVQEKFSFIKGIGFFGIFVLVTLMQVLIPYRKNLNSDFKNWLVNLPLGAINAGLLSLICGSCVCVWSIYIKNQGWGAFNLLALPFILQLTLSILILDSISYIWHWANHSIKFLWKFHSVHHSDINFDTSTAIRFHPGELIISLGIRFFIVGFFGLPVLGILGFELFYQLFNIFEHGNIRLPSRMESILNLIFITPALHRKHHSQVRSELNSNYGTIFSFWDRLGETFRKSASNEKITVGLPSQKEKLSLMKALLLPTRKIFS